MDCGYPQQVDHSVVEFTNRTLFNSTAEYQCDSGYEFINGSSERVCQSNGTWSGAAPVCAGIRLNGSNSQVFPISNS